ncbi:MAG TPA: phosphotransferase [Thermoanaerobaculia bacterium]|nr:phosphotransferase [Thermoanaerobaculia bacterium]
MPATTPLPWPEISGWLQHRGYRVREVVPLTGDVSLRRYFRLHLEAAGTAVLAHYPGELRCTCRRFRHTTRLLQRAGVAVPRVLASECRRGWMLVEDAGGETLYETSAGDWEALAPLYRQAADYVRRICSLSAADVAAVGNPPLDAPLLRWELQKTWQRYLLPQGMTGDAALQRELAAALDRLCEELAALPPLPCHRDFMPRNLMPRAGELLVLDHQDLRLGPPAYDLASLLNDSLFPPAALEEELVAALCPEPASRQAYRRTVVQRSIKAVGNYCDFAARGFDRHLPLVAPTLQRAWRWFPELPELAPLVPRLQPLWAGKAAGAVC